jgi:hypothetical protein
VLIAERISAISKRRTYRGRENCKDEDHVHLSRWSFDGTRSRSGESFWKASATGQGKKDGSKGSVLGIKVSADLAKHLSVVEAQIVPSNGRSEALRLLFSFWFEKQKLTLTQNKNAEKPARQASRATALQKKIITETAQKTILSATSNIRLHPAPHTRQRSR